MKINRSGQATAITEQQFLLIRSCFTNDAHKLLISLAWYTTERWGALLKTRTEALYEGKDRPGNPRAKIVIQASNRKDGVTREVMVSPKLRKALVKYRPKEHGYIVPNRTGDGSQEMRVAYAALKRACDRAGLGEAGIATHSTRRGAITTLARAGVNVRVIQEFTGHASLDNVQRYIDCSETDLLKAASLL